MAGRIKPIPPEVMDQVTDMVRQGKGERLIRKATGLSSGRARRAMREARKILGTVAPPSHTRDLLKDEMAIAGAAREYLKKVSSLKRMLDRKITWSPPDATLPVGIAFMGDIHIGDDNTDYEKYEVDKKLIMKTPNLWCVMGGDMIDNHIRHLSAVIAAGVKPGLQWRILAQELADFKEKLVAVVAGNHEQWTAAMSGFDPLRALAEKISVPYDSDELSLLLRLGKLKYNILVRHKYRFSSVFNAGHKVKRLWELGDEPFDVGVVCHDHMAHIEPFVKHREVRWAVRPGTYQTGSAFARRHGYHGAMPVTPMVVFEPHTKKCHAFLDLETGVTYLKARVSARKSSQKTARRTA